MALGPAVMLGLAIAVGATARPVSGAVILRYEQIGEEGPFAAQVALEDFEAHLAYLAEQQYAVWPIEKIIAHLKFGLPLPERCVALTFDGGSQTVHDLAFPRLLERGWPFTVFVTTEAIDMHAPGHLSWDQMREMRKVGIKFAGQGHDPQHLLRRNPGESEEDWATRVKEDIHYARARVFDQLGQTSELFAYPFGEYDAALRDLVLSQNLTGLGLHAGAIGPGSDFGALPRFALEGDAGTLEEFIRRVRSLPFPVLAVEPLDPYRETGEAPPVLRVTLGPGDYDAEALAGSVRGPDDLLVRWIDRDSGVIELVARSPLPSGWSAYTLMAPHRDGGRYFWFSHPWVVGRPTGE